MRFTKRTVQNYLELIPVRNVKEFTETDGKITLLVPKFKNEKFGRWFIPRRKSTHFRIHLDSMGSSVWNFINGKRTVNEICDLLEEQFNNNQSIEQLEERVTHFLSELYKSRFITFEFK